MGSLLVMKFLEYGVSGLVIFIVVHWSCDLVWLSFVSVLVYRTHRLWGRFVQEIIFIGCALLLGAFGIWFVVSGVQKLL